MKKFLRYIFYAVISITLLFGGLMLWASWKTQRALDETRTFTSIKMLQPGDVELGKRIATVRNGCVDCHGHDLAGSLVMDDPMMGRIWASNISPANLKTWSDQEVAQAIRNGVNQQHHALILMPSHEYQNLSIEDLSAVVAYLRSVPPVEKQTPPIKLGPLARVLFALGQMPTLIPATSLIRSDLQFVVKPPEAPTAQFGKYLLTASCTGCHRPDLTGGPIPGGPPSWAPAASLRGLSKQNWTYQTFATAMRQGQSIDGHALKYPMPTELTKQMSDTELQAMWAALEQM